MSDQDDEVAPEQKKDKTTSKHQKRCSKCGGGLISCDDVFFHLGKITLHRSCYQSIHNDLIFNNNDSSDDEEK